LSDSVVDLFPHVYPLHGSFLDEWGMAVEVHETALVVELGEQTAEYGGSVEINI
jgi:hypothetical protein